MCAVSDKTIVPQADTQGLPLSFHACIEYSALESLTNVVRERWIYYDILPLVVCDRADYLTVAPNGQVPDSENKS